MIQGIKLQLIDATPYGMNFVQYYEQFVKEVVAYLQKGEIIDILQLIKSFSNHKLFPLLRFLSQKGWQLHLTRQNLQESSLHERPQRSEKDISEIEFEFEPDISFQENSLDLSESDSLSTGETSEIDISINSSVKESIPNVNIKVKLPSGEIKYFENLKSNISLRELKRMCIDNNNNNILDSNFFYGNQILSEADVLKSVPVKVIGPKESTESEINKVFAISESMTFSDFKNKMHRTKKNKNQKLKNSKVRVGDISVSLEGTLIVPSDGLSYHVPPNLGHIEMFEPSKTDKFDVSNWKKSFSDNKSNKVFIAPLYSHKAFWINFDSQKRFNFLF